MLPCPSVRGPLLGSAIPAAVGVQGPPVAAGSPPQPLGVGSTQRQRRELRAAPGPRAASCGRRSRFPDTRRGVAGRGRRVSSSVHGPSAPTAARKLASLVQTSSRPPPRVGASRGGWQGPGPRRRAPQTRGGRWDRPAPRAGVASVRVVPIRGRYLFGTEVLSTYFFPRKGHSLNV